MHSRCPCQSYKKLSSLEWRRCWSFLDSVWLFSIPTQQCCLLKWLAVVAFKPVFGLEHGTYTSRMVFWLMSIWATSPIWPFIKRSWIFVLAINITLAPIFSWRDFFRRASGICFCFCAPWITENGYNHLEFRKQFLLT